MTIKLTGDKEREYELSEISSSERSKVEALCKALDKLTSKQRSILRKYLEATQQQDVLSAPAHREIGQ